MGAKSLILTHMADEEKHRRERFTAEAATAFNGLAHVPGDGDEITI